MKTYRILYGKKPPACVKCGKELDAATPLLAERLPKKGDPTICAYCGCIMQFTADLRLKALDTLEHFDAETRSQLLDAQKHCRKMHQ